MVREGIEWHPSANEHECGGVEKQIDDGGKDRCFSLFVEKTVPGKGGSTDEAGEEIVRAKETSRADRKKSK